MTMYTLDGPTLTDLKAAAAPHVCLMIASLAWRVDGSSQEAINCCNRAIGALHRHNDPIDACRWVLAGLVHQCQGGSPAFARASRVYRHVKGIMRA